MGQGGPFGSQAAIHAELAGRSGQSRHGVPLGLWGEHVGVVGANRLPEVAGPAWGPSACQRAPRAAGRLISGAMVPWTMHELRRSSATERLPNLTQDPVAGLAGSGPLWGVAR